MLIRYPRRVTVNNKRLISKRQKSEKNIQKPWQYEKSQREINPIALVRSSWISIISICPEDRNVFARFDEIQSMTL